MTLNNDEIIDMFNSLGASVAVLDENMNMMYMNEKARWFYKTVFGAGNILGKNVSACHEPVNIKNIKGLFEQFKAGKPFSFFHAAPPMIEGGQITVLHFPCKRNGEIIGIMEINIESSLLEGGRCEYERTTEE